jgi:DNA polymerase-4
MNITKNPKDFQVLCLDMNSFFASVEQQVRPDLRGRPVGVAPYIGDSGCIVAASVEAKRLGIKTGTKVGEAKQIYPLIEILETRPALYMLYHKEIQKVLEDFSPHIEPLSVDEFIIPLTLSEQNFWSSYNIAKQIKQAILKRAGEHLTCSVGVSTNRFLAKMASNAQKPDGLTVLKLSNLEKFYESLKLTDLTGINVKMAKQIMLKGMSSPKELYSSSISDMYGMFGHWGKMWYFRLRGYEVDDLGAKEAKTVGHSHVLEPDFRSKAGATAVIKKLLYKTGYRLRKKRLLASGISVVVKFRGGEGFIETKKVPQFDDDMSLYRHAVQMLEGCKWQGVPVFVSVSACYLGSGTSIQLSIFDDIKKMRSISRALDEVSDEYGAGNLYPASMYEAISIAPDRIPFGRVRYDIRNF